MQINCGQRAEAPLDVDHNWFAFLKGSPLFKFRTLLSDSVLRPKRQKMRFNFHDSISIPAPKHFIHQDLQYFVFLDTSFSVTYLNNFIFIVTVQNPDVWISGIFKKRPVVKHLDFRRLLKSRQLCPDFRRCNGSWTSTVYACGKN